MRAEGGGDKETWRELAPSFWPPANAAELGLEKWSAGSFGSYVRQNMKLIS